MLQHFQSVDNEIVLWEPKVKEQTPGEVWILICCILKLHCVIFDQFL